MSEVHNGQLIGARPAGDEVLELVGRLRRWHSKQEWGFIFSELHFCDIFLDGSNVEASSELSAGDLVLFELDTDEEGHLAARNVRRADSDQVAQQQEHLAQQGVYQQYVARAPQVPELPKNHDCRATPSSPSASIGTVMPQEMQPPVTIPQHDVGTAVLPNTSPIAVAPRHHDPLRRSPPPPPPLPPPTHPAPTGPGNFASQGLNSVGLLQQPPFMAHQIYGAPYGNYVNDRSFAIYQQGPPPVIAGQNPPTRLLLEPPPMLDRLDPKVVVSVLKGGPWPGRRSQTFRSSRSGTATQIGQEWCQILRQVVNEHGCDDADRHPQAAAWSDAQWPGAQPW